MANLAEVKKTALTKKENAVQIEELINSSLKELGKAMPACMNAERLARIAFTSIRLNPTLAECTPQSFLGALFQSAQLGLEPNIEGQAYLIPYSNSKNINGVWVKKKEVQFQIGYKGYIELFYRHDMASSIDMQAVYENDFFEYEFGTDGFIKHRPTLKNRGEVIAYYAVAKLKNGGSVFKVMSKDECVEHGKIHSKSYTNGSFDKNSPWAKDLDAMCKKTVLLQLAKLMPKSVELQKALAMDNTTKSVFRPDMFEVKDETNWEDDTVVIPPTTDEAGE